MDLENFIKETLISIKKGLVAANNECKAIGNKNLGHHIGDFQMGGPGDVKNNHIKFDIAVSATEEKAGSKGGGIKIKVVDISGEKNNKSTDQMASRIQFEIKVANFLIN